MIRPRSAAFVALGVLSAAFGAVAQTGRPPNPTAAASASRRDTPDVSGIAPKETQMRTEITDMPTWPPIDAAYPFTYCSPDLLREQWIAGIDDPIRS